MEISQPQNGSNTALEEKAISVYNGYVPKTPEDFIFIAEGDVPNNADVHQEERGEGNTVQDGSQPRSRGRLVSLILLSSCVTFFIIAVSFSIFGAECKLGLCNKVDYSSSLTAKYISSLFPFNAPLKYVWAAFAVSVLGLAVFALLGFFLFKIDRIPGNMRRVALVIRTEGGKFLLKELVFVLCLIAVVFTLSAVEQLWRLGGSFILGNIFALILMGVVAVMTNRGSLTAAAVGQDSVQRGLQGALRVGSTVSLLVVSMSVGGLSFAYLVLQDVRSLSGYVLGISCVALIARVSGGLYKKAGQFVADAADWMCPITKSSKNMPSGILDSTEWMCSVGKKKNPLLLTSSIGSILGNASGMSIDVMSTFVTTIAATAILGAHVPYFFENPYAMCVHDHLALDKECTMLDDRGAKVALSATVCRLENFYREYPSLSTWESNSLFVALPFILGLVAVLISCVCSLHFVLPRTDELPTYSEPRVKVSKSVTYRVSLNVLVASLLMIICSAGICWGLFGRNSEFGKGQAVQVTRKELPPLTTENADTRCLPAQPEDGTSGNKIPELVIVNAPYQPMDSSGEFYTSSTQVAWRLFVCILLGCVCGVGLGLMVDWCNDLMRLPRKERATSLDHGRGALTTNALGNGMVSVTCPVVILLVLMIASFKLQGSYGVGLCTLGLLSSAGPIIAFEALTSIADAAVTITQAPGIPIMAWRTADFISLVANKLNSVSRGVLSGSAFLSSFALISVLLVESGLVPSSKQLAGTLDSKPSRHITDFKGISASDIYVITSAILGTLLPCLFSAFILLSGSRAKAVTAWEVYKNTDEHNSPNWNGELVQNLNGRFTKLLSASTLFNSALPLLLAVTAPLIVGFGFGQRGLIAFTTLSVSVAFILSVAMNNTGRSLVGLQMLVEGGKHELNSMIPLWREAARTGQEFGQSLIDCCAPSLLALTKFLSALAIIIVPLPSKSIERGWIGIILFVAAIIIGLLVGFGMRKWKQKQGVQAYDHEEFYRHRSKAKPAVNANFVSPFYEEGPMVPAHQVHPQSNLALVPGSCGSIGFGGDIGLEEWVPMDSSEVDAESQDGRMNV